MYFLLVANNLTDGTVEFPHFEVWVESDEPEGAIAAASRAFGVPASGLRVDAKSTRLGFRGSRKQLGVPITLCPN